MDYTGGLYWEYYRIVALIYDLSGFVGQWDSGHADA
jgi:hypothetical protein